MIQRCYTTNSLFLPLRALRLCVRFPLSVIHLCFIRGSILFLALIVCTGCGNTYEATVTGNVAHGGKPLALGTITFHPEGRGPVAYARIQTDGSYSLTTGEQVGIVPGKYRVTVVATETIPPPANSIASPTGRLITPGRYGDVKTTDLAAEVKPGSNTFDFELR